MMDTLIDKYLYITLCESACMLDVHSQLNKYQFLNQITYKAKSGGRVKWYDIPMALHGKKELIVVGWKVHKKNYNVFQSVIAWS